MAEIKRTKRIELLDYLKAVGIIMVIITHYDWTYKNTPFFTLLINMAVPIFMIISGYNFAMSNKRKAQGDIRQMYGMSMLKSKLERFLVPYYIIAFIEIWLRLLYGRSVDFLRLLLFEGYGAGSYYVPVMIQLLFVFPIIYWLVDKNKKWGLVAVGGLNVLFEAAIVIFEIEKAVYRVSVGRYLLLIGLGCYLYLYGWENIKKKQLLVMFGIGMTYIIGVFGFGADLVLFPYWKTTAMPVAFYIFPIIVLLFQQYYDATIPGKIGKLLTKIGQGSYHIFLIQMVYFHFDLGGPIMSAPWIFAVPCHLIITITVGLGYYKLESEISLKIRGKIGRK